MLEGGRRMIPKLAGLKVTVLGGDKRDKVVMQYLLRQQVIVKAVGFCESITGVQTIPDLKAGIQDTDAIVGPIFGTDDTGRIKRTPNGQNLVFSQELFAQIPTHVPILMGSMPKHIVQMANHYGLRVIQYANMDELAVLNSVPTAEGAIQVAMQELPITIHESRVVVLGFGRVGATLAKMLKALGAQVQVVSKDPLELAKAQVAGLQSIPWTSLSTSLTDAQLIYNTVPALVLTAEILETVFQQALIIDIASAPGGTDFSAAKQKGIRAMSCLGLPGKVAPQTAGAYLAETISTLLERECLT